MASNNNVIAALVAMSDKLALIDSELQHQLEEVEMLRLLCNQPIPEGVTADKTEVAPPASEDTTPEKRSKRSLLLFQGSRSSGIGKNVKNALKHRMYYASGYEEILEKQCYPAMETKEITWVNYTAEEVAEWVAEDKDYAREAARISKKPTGLK